MLDIIIATWQRGDIHQYHSRFIYHGNPGLTRTNIIIIGDHDRWALSWWTALAEVFYHRSSRDQSPPRDLNFEESPSFHRTSFFVVTHFSDLVGCNKASQQEWEIYISSNRDKVKYGRDDDTSVTSLLGSKMINLHSIEFATLGCLARTDC